MLNAFASGVSRLILTLALLAPEGSSIQETVDFSGTVTGVGGQPARHASVFVTRANPGDGSSTIASGRADAEGRFTIECDVIEFHDSWRAHEGVCQVWAVEPGTGIGMAATRVRTDARSVTGLNVRVSRAATLSVQVLAPNGRPLADASVAARTFVVGDRWYTLPDDWAERFGTRTDDNGIAHVLGIAAGQSPRVLIAHALYGEQRHAALLEAGELSLVTLVPTGALRGSIRGALPDDPSRLRVAWSCRVPIDDPRNQHCVGTASAAVSASGDFVIPAAAAGAGQLWLHEGADEQRGFSLRQQAVVRDSEEVAIELELPVRTRVVGQLERVENGDGPPPVKLLFYGDTWTATAQPDASGEFAFLAPPGSASVHVRGLPSDWLLDLGEGPGLVARRYSIPRAASHRLPPIRVRRPIVLTGRVVNEHGEPVPEAWLRFVDGSDALVDWRTWTHYRRANDEGQFEITGLRPGKSFAILAGKNGRCVAEPVWLVAKEKADAPVVIEPLSGRFCSGRVVDGEGRPILGAELRFRYLDRTERYSNPSFHEMEVWGEDVVHTRADGSFRSHRGFRPEWMACADVSAPGFVEIQTTPVDTSAEEEIVFPDIVLSESVVLSGRVLDGNGAPVTGATIEVVSRWSGRRLDQSGADGSFAVEEVLDGPALVFVDAPGFRFFGRAIERADECVELTLARREEAPQRELHSLPPLPSEEGNLATARRLLVHVAEGSEVVDRLRQIALEKLASLDSDATLTLLEKRPLGEEWQNRAVRQECAYALASGEYERAVVLLEASEDPYVRSYGLMNAAKRNPGLGRERELDLLGRSVLAARAVEEPAKRVLRLGEIGARLVMLDLPDEGRNLLGEAAAIARDLPVAGWGGFARGQFASDLAVTDLEAALELLKPLEDNDEFDRHTLTIARRLARTDPTRALELVAQPRGRLWRAVGQVAYEVSKSDLDSALRQLRLSAAAHNDWRTMTAFVFIAEERVDRDPSGALEVIERAVALVQREREERRSDRVPATVLSAKQLISVLPTIERAAPDRLEEFLWLGLSVLEPQKARTSQSTWPWARDRAVAAAFVARYDRALAESMVRDVLDRLPQVTRHSRDADLHEILGAAALVSPGLAIRALEGLPDFTDEWHLHSKPRAEIEIATALMQPPEAALRWARDRYVVAWPLEEDDR